MSLTNAVVLALAFGGLLVAPVSVSVPGAASELAVLGAGLLGLLAVSLALLRPAFRPLDELAETMHRHEPLAPGTRARVAGDPDVAALADAFTSCSNGSSSSAATARAARSCCRRPNNGGSLASSTTTSAPRRSPA